MSKDRIYRLTTCLLLLFLFPSVCLASSQCACEAQDIDVSHVSSNVDISIPTDLTGYDGECENATHSCVALSCQLDASTDIIVSSLDPNTSGYDWTKSHGQIGGDPEVTDFTGHSTSFKMRLPIKLDCNHYKQYHFVFQDANENETGSATIKLVCNNCTANS